MVNFDDEAVTDEDVGSGPPGSPGRVVHVGNRDGHPSPYRQPRVNAGCDERAFVLASPRLATTGGDGAKRGIPNDLLRRNGLPPTNAPRAAGTDAPLESNQRVTVVTCHRDVSRVCGRTPEVAGQVVCCTSLRLIGTPGVEGVRIALSAEVRSDRFVEVVDTVDEVALGAARPVSDQDAPTAGGRRNVVPLPRTTFRDGGKGLAPPVAVAAPPEPRDGRQGSWHLRQVDPSVGLGVPALERARAF